MTAGLNEPQLELEQLTDQLTPLFIGSFATVAVIEALLPAGTVEGTWWDDVIVTGGVVIWMVAEADLVLSAVAVTGDGHVTSAREYRRRGHVNVAHQAPSGVRGVGRTEGTAC